MTSEIWRPVPFAPYYQASSEGRVRSLDRWVPHSVSGYVLRNGQILKQTVNTTDRLQVVLHVEGKAVNKSVHSIVCSAFYGPAPDNKPWALHRNGDHRDNRAVNLYWGDPGENAKDMVRHGNHRESRETHCIRGHEKTPENMYVRPDGRGRMCRACVSMRSKKYNQERTLLNRRRGLGDVSE